MGPVIGRRAGHDAVKIGRIALRLHQRLAPAVRAGIEIRALRRRSIKRKYYAFGSLSRFMNRAIPEVRNLLRMTERPGGIGPTSVVPGIGGSGGITMRNGAGERVEIDGPGEA